METEVAQSGSETAGAGSRQELYGRAAGIVSLEFSPVHGGLTRLQHWISQNESAALRLSLAHAAKIACLETCHLSRTFHQLVGMSFRQWRFQYRIAWAVAALQSGGRTLAEIIQQAGYHDRRAFERAFRRVTGKTPGELRRETRKRPVS